MICVYKNISNQRRRCLAKEINNLIRNLLGSPAKLKVMSRNERSGTSRANSRPSSSRAPSTAADEASTMNTMETNLTNLLSRLSLVTEQQRPSQPPTPRATLISDLTFDGLLHHWKTHGFKRIITMVGAGISTSAGIPDFRSPGTGLYNNLKKYNLPTPTDIFELNYFMENPKPFMTLAKELYPDSFTPTPAHYFIRLMHEKNLLIRHYTQNIDSLERIAGVPEDKLVEAHGTFFTSHCVGCRKPHTKDWMKEKIFNEKLPKCLDCASLVKPDIIFFGENLPERFYELPEKDFEDCDLLIVMGTSLEVYPFAALVNYVGPQCIRLLINRTPIHQFNVESPKNVRDISFIGDCDDAIWQIAEALDWAKELRDLIDGENKSKSPTKTPDNKPYKDSKLETSKDLTTSHAVDSKQKT
ncbi:NAD-dependent protein deacetylase Sirt2-like [Eurosta solidaginis]|uniref:NAD-dependent protein deacetylase Sirt2-like n=1 Tax=Eurosta solidaginis TaxID=178769 RepID=UPI003530A1AE